MRTGQQSPAASGEATTAGTPGIDEDCCIVRGRVIYASARPAAQTIVDAWMMGGNDHADEVITDENGYYSLRLEKGWIVNIKYSTADKKYVAWSIAENYVVRGDDTLTTAIVGQKM